MDKKKKNKHVKGSRGFLKPSTVCFVLFSPKAIQIGDKEKILFLQVLCGVECGRV